MNSQLRLANIFRRIARVVSVFLIISIVLYLLFIGLQLLSGEPGLPGFTLYLILNALMLAGLVIAWRWEGLGAALLLVVLLVGPFVMGQTLPGFDRGSSLLLGASVLTGPISLILALIMEGFGGREQQAQGVAAWLLTLAPVALFAASWWLRRRPPAKAAPPDNQPDRLEGARQS